MKYYKYSNSYGKYLIISDRHYHRTKHLIDSCDRLLNVEWHERTYPFDIKDYQGTATEITEEEFFMECL